MWLEAYLVLYIFGKLFFVLMLISCLTSSPILALENGLTHLLVLQSEKIFQMMTGDTSN